MSEWRDMERRHVVQQIRKMEEAARGSRKVAEQIRRQMRGNQRNMHRHEWTLEFGPAYLSEKGRESMSRAVAQLGRMVEHERHSLEIAVTADRQAAANLEALQRKIAKLDRWDRWAGRLEDWFWPVTIVRACWTKTFQNIPQS